jgi:hypothetical protein
MVHDDDLSLEGFYLSSRAVLGIRSNITSLDVLDGYVLNVETDIVSGNSFLQLFVMHFNRLTFSLYSDRGEENSHTGFQYTSFYSSYGDSSDTTDLVHVL